MSVRLREWADRNGRHHKVWQIHIVQEGSDGVLVEVRKHSEVNTQRAALREEREIRNRISLGTWVNGARREIPTLEKFADEFLKTYALKNNKPSVYTEKEKILRLYLIPFFGKYRLDQIPPKTVEEFKATHVGSPKYLNNKLVVFGRLLRVAAEWKVIPEQAIPPIRLVEVQEKEFRILDWDAEVPVLLNNLDGQWYRMAVLALNTGLRIGEMRALQWGDIQASKIVVRRNLWRGKVTSPKHGRVRTVPLNVDAERVLGEQPKRGLWVFCNPDGSQLGDQQGDSALENACTAGAIRSVKWHALRHTFGTRLAAQGVPAKVIQELLGHASLRTTERYMNFAPKAKQAAVDMLSGARQQHIGSTQAVDEMAKVLT